MENETRNQLSQELQACIRRFCQGTDIARIRRSLHLVFFDYLRHVSDGLPLEFDQILNDMESVFDLVDRIAAEQPK